MRVSQAIICALSIVIGGQGWATPVEHKTVNLVSIGNSPNDPEAVIINPVTLRTLFFSGSTSVLTGLNGVYQAKESVNVARGSVLPSINLSAAVSAVSSFGLTSVSALLPFLLPGNWANLESSREQLVASGAAFYLTELNSYASLYALYLTILSDTETFEILSRQAQIQQEIETITADLLQIGGVSVGDLKLASSQAKSAQAAALRVKELLVSEKASLRLMLSLPNKKLVFQKSHLEPSVYESWSSEQILKMTFKKSPEARQILALLAASKAGEWSAAFSFLNGAALTAPTNENGITAFGRLGQSTASLNVGIGFGYPASIRLSSLNTDALKTRLLEIKNEESGAIDTVVNSLPSAIQQTKLAKDAEQDALDSFQEQIGKYKQGQITTMSMKEVASNVLTLGISRVSTQLDLDNQRLNLARITLSDEFKNIPTCRIQLDRTAEQNPLTWINDLFKPQATQVSVDQLCRFHEKHVANKRKSVVSRN